MKKLIVIFILYFSFIVKVDANSINSINMDIFIDNQGTANITEIWDMNLTKDTEGYKPYYNLGNSEIKKFMVTDENNNKYQFVNNWDIDGTLNDKSYKNGFNYIDNGIELCWGLSEYGHRTYTLKYQITNFVHQLTDSQMIYWTLIPYELSIELNQVNIVIRSDQKFSDSIDVWGYGNYGGTAYVSNGNIEMNSDGTLDSKEYMVILVKLPTGMFNTPEVSNYDFNYYYNMAQEGAEKYKEADHSFLDIIVHFIPYIIVLFIFKAIKTMSDNLMKRDSFRKKISKGKFPKDLPYYRDIPCNKNIYYAFFLATNYNLNEKKTDFFGAILLDWIRKDYIAVEKKMEKKLFGEKEETYIKLKKYALTNDDLESKIYNNMYPASKDGILEPKEFEKYCKDRYESLFDWFDRVIQEQRDECVAKNLLLKEKKYFTNYYETQDIYEDAKKLAGLKKFLEDFSQIEDKSAIQVHLWEYYLQYAQIFGIAKKVETEFKKLYPDMITDIKYDDIVFIYDFADVSMRSAASARSAASSYSGGGGGFSSGGGGGGSSGGGGGGGGTR